MALRSSRVLDTIARTARELQLWAAARRRESIGRRTDAPCALRVALNKNTNRYFVLNPSSCEEGYQIVVQNGTNARPGWVLYPGQAVGDWEAVES